MTPILFSWVLWSLVSSARFGIIQYFIQWKVFVASFSTFLKLPCRCNFYYILYFCFVLFCFVGIICNLIYYYFFIYRFIAPYINVQQYLQRSLHHCGNFFQFFLGQSFSHHMGHVYMSTNMGSKLWNPKFFLPHELELVIERPISVGFPLWISQNKIISI